MSYVSVVVNFLDTRFAKVQALSPEDYSAIAEWEKQQIPLTLALNSMDKKAPELIGQISASHIFEELNREVIREFAEWLQTQDH